MSADRRVQLSTWKEGVSAEQSEAVYLKGSECHLPGVKECLQIECSCLVSTWKEGVSAEQSVADCRLPSMLLRPEICKNLIILHKFYNISIYISDQSAIESNSWKRACSRLKQL